MNHTPGPWVVTTDHAGKTATVYADSQCARVCTFLGVVTRNLGPNEIKANAQLIAAAPDLLAALEYAIKQVPELVTVPGIGAAIAKATGAAQ